MASLASQLARFDKQKDFAEISSIVKNIDSHAIYTEIDKVLSLKKFPRFLEYLLEGCHVDEEWAYVKRTKIIIHCLKQIKQHQETNQVLPDDQIKQVITRIIMCIGDTKFMPEHLVRSKDEKQGPTPFVDSWMDLIPVILKKMLTYEQVEYQDNIITTHDYHLEIIRRLLGLEWSTNIINVIAEMFLKIPMPPTETNKVMTKLTKAFESLEPDAIPPLVYHLLRYTNSDGHILFCQLQTFYGGKIYDHKTYIGSICSESLQSSYDASMVKLIESESNTIYHIFRAFFEKSVQQYFRFLANATKLPECILHPFNLTLLLMASAQYDNDNSLDVIKTAVYRYYLEEEKRSKSCYFRENLAQHCQLQNVISQIITIGVENRESALDGLQKLAFVLMTVRPQIGREGIAEKLGKLGSLILIRIIEKKVNMIPRVIRWINDALRRRQSTALIMDCLATIAKKFTYVTVQSMPLVMNILNDFSFITNYEANAFLEVVMRLVRYRPLVKDQILNKLQNSLHSNELETRLNVTTAYLKLLKYLRISSASNLSQGSSSSQHSISTQIHLSRTLSGNVCVFTNEAICLESIYNLKSRFCLQVEVKQLLYKGLPDVVGSNVELGVPILELLWNGFNDFKEVEPDTLPPIMFQNICKVRHSQTVLNEPIGQMILAIALVLAHLVQVELANGTDIEELVEYKDMFQDLANKMGQCDLEQLVQKQDLDLTDNSVESQEQILVIHECIAIFEAFITYFILTWTNTNETVGNTIKSLFKSYKRLVNHLKDYKRNKKVEKKNNTIRSVSQNLPNTSTAPNNVTRPIGSVAKKLKAPATILPLHSLTRIIELLYSDSVPWALNEEGNILKVDVQFHRYILESFISVAQQIKQTKQLDADTKTYYHNNLKAIEKILYTRCVKRHQNLMDFDVTTATFALEAYYSILVLHMVHMNDKMEDDTATDSPLERDEIEFVLATYRDLLDSVEDDDDPDSARLILVLVNTIALIAQKMPIENKVLCDRFMDWMKATCLGKNLIGKLPASHFVSCLLNTSLRFQSTTLLWKVVIIALGAVIGWQPEEPPEVGDELAMVNASTAPAILQTVLNEFKSYLDDVDWIIDSIKTEYTYVIRFKAGTIDHAHSQLKNKERNVCTKVQELVTILSLANHLSYQAAGQPQTDQMLKNNIHMFTCLTTLAKYFLATSTRDDLAFQQARFDNLVRHVIKKLVPIVYDQIKYIEQKQEKPKANKKRTETNTLKKKVLKDALPISKIIFGIEQFKKIVMQISKKTKVEVYGNLGIGIVRDFRIRNLKDVVGEQSIDETASDIMDDSVSDVADNTDAPDVPEVITETSDEDEPPVSVSPAKRRRL